MDGKSMVLKDRVFHEPPAAAEWIAALRARLPGITFLLVHFGGALLLGYAIKEAWFFRLGLRVLSSGWLIGRLLHLPWTAGFMALGLAWLAVLAESSRVVRRLWRGEPEPDVGLRWRVLVYTALGCVVFQAF